MEKKKSQHHKPTPYRLPPTTKKHWLNEGDAYYREKRYDEALAAYDHAIELDPHYADAYYNNSIPT